MYHVEELFTAQLGYQTAQQKQKLLTVCSADSHISVPSFPVVCQTTGKIEQTPRKRQHTDGVLIPIFAEGMADDVSNIPTNKDFSTLQTNFALSPKRKKDSENGIQIIIIFIFNIMFSKNETK